jgi:hypothetical protein
MGSSPSASGCHFFASYGSPIFELDPHGEIVPIDASSRRMPEPNTGDRNSHGSRVDEFRTAKLRRGSPRSVEDQGAARMIEDYYDFPIGSDF